MGAEQFGNDDRIDEYPKARLNDKVGSVPLVTVVAETLCYFALTNGKTTALWEN
jgi:hypothetical protein